jgi:hypothetical protein
MKYFNIGKERAKIRGKVAIPLRSTKDARVDSIPFACPFFYFPFSFGAENARMTNSTKGTPTNTIQGTNEIVNRNVR